MLSRPAPPPPPRPLPARCGCKVWWCLYLSCCWSWPAIRMSQSSTSMPVGSSRLRSLQTVRVECAGTKLRLTIKWASSALVHFGEAENTLWGPQQDKVRCRSNLHAMVEIDCLKFPAYMAYDLTWITVSKPAELDSSDGQSANVGAARPCHLHWRYVTTFNLLWMSHF